MLACSVYVGAHRAVSMAVDSQFCLWQILTSFILHIINVYVVHLTEFY